MSCFDPTVSLWDWWLTTARDDLGTILAVAGFASDHISGKPPHRFCSSLPILKRYDWSILETTDGKCVLLKGLMNKERSQNNGFPADVFSRFVYGFPPYWKKLADDYIVKATPCEQLPICNDLLLRDTVDAKSIQENIEITPSAAILLQNSDTSISTPEEKSHMSSAVPRDEGNNSGCSMVKDHAIVDMPVNSVTEIMKSCIISSSVEELNALAVNTEDSQVHESRQNPSIRTGGREVDDSLPKVNVKDDLKCPINKRVGTRSMSRLKMEKMNGKASVALSLVSNEVEVTNGDCELRSGNNLHVEDSQLNTSSHEKYSSELNVGSVEDTPNQICGTSNPEKGLKKFKRKGTKKMAKKGNIQSLRVTVLPSVGPDKVELAVSDTNVEDSQVLGSRENLSTCHISTQTKGRKGDKSLQNVKVNLKEPIMANLDGSVNSAVEIVAPTYSRARTRLISNLETDKMNGKSSVKPLGGEKIRSNSVSLSLGSDKIELTQVHGELRDGKFLHVEDTQVLECNGESYSSELNVSSVTDMFEQSGEALNPVKGVNSRRLRRKTNNGGTQSLIKTVSSPMGSNKVELAFGGGGPGGGNSLHVDDTQLDKSNDKKNSCLLHTGSVEDKSEQILEAANPGKRLKNAKTTGNQKAKNGGTQLRSKSLTADGNKLTAVSHHRSSTENVKKSVMSAARTLRYGTPEKGNKIKPGESPQLSSLKRSRSGRILLPKLENWRNQVATYNADRMVIGLKEDKQPELSRKGTGPTAKKRRR